MTKTVTLYQTVIQFLVPTILLSASSLILGCGKTSNTSNGAFGTQNGLYNFPNGTGANSQFTSCGTVNAVPSNIGTPYRQLCRTTNGLLVFTSGNGVNPSGLCVIPIIYSSGSNYSFASQPNCSPQVNGTDFVIQASNANGAILVSSSYVNQFMSEMSTYGRTQVGYAIGRSF